MCLIFCDPTDCSPPGSSLRGISQTRILEWVAIPFSGDLPDPGIEPRSPALQADSLPLEPPGEIKGINSLSVLKTRSLRSRRQQGTRLPHLSQQLVLPGILGVSWPETASFPSSASIFLPGCLCLPRPSLLLVSVSVSHSVMPDSLPPQGLQSTRLLCP